MGVKCAISFAANEQVRRQFPYATFLAKPFTIENLLGNVARLVGETIVAG